MEKASFAEPLWFFFSLLFIFNNCPSLKSDLKRQMQKENNFLYSKNSN